MGVDKLKDHIADAMAYGTAARKVTFRRFKPFAAEKLCSDIDPCCSDYKSCQYLMKKGNCRGCDSFERWKLNG